MSGSVRITDVSPRDGLQNEPGVISTADKAELVRLVGASGVDEVEVTSFVSPKWVPQLGDAADLLPMCAAFKRSGQCYSVLVPNDKGMDGAGAVNAARPGLIDKISLFTAASETFSRKNTNASIDETLDRFRPVLKRAAASGLAVRLYVSCAIACPFEGDIAPERVAAVVQRLLILAGHDDFAPKSNGGRTFANVEIDLGDTIGAGTEAGTRRLLDAVQRLDAWTAFSWCDRPLVLHLHDTFGRAAECVRAALEMGVRSFDGSVAGLGGCPYASTPGHRAPGNIATETLVRTIQGAGFSTRVDLARLADAAAFARDTVARARAAQADKDRPRA
ncbi:MAG: hydroxymethylglutaryl-CoA lyase [Phycisphaerae bacterium]|nr:hydroxymethylglutaryl-CoA lyase [Phycisphaerae bacterium]